MKRNPWLNKAAAGCMLAVALLALPAAAETASRYRAQVHTDLGSLYYGNGQLGVALEEMAKAIKSDSSYVPAYNVLGLIYMELHEDDKAEENFQRALKLDPTNSDAQNNYGWFLCQRGRPDQSIPHFFEALKNPLYSSPEKPYLNAGICSRKKGDDQEAEGYFIKSLKFQPQQPQALYNLADIYFRRGNYSEAKSYVGRLMEISSPTADGLWLAVRLARRMGDRDSEASYGLQLRKRFPDSREAQALRNQQYDNYGDGK